MLHHIIMYWWMAQNQYTVRLGLSECAIHEFIQALLFIFFTYQKGILIEHC